MFQACSGRIAPPPDCLFAALQDHRLAIGIRHQVGMYLRFSTKKWDPDSTRNLGILVAAHELRDEGNISQEEHELLRKTIKWFNEQLAIPEILEDKEHRRAISWFKPQAKEAIRRMWELSELLKQHGIQIEVHKSKDPGIVIYEDGWQIVAKPRKGEKVPW